MSSMLIVNGYEFPCPLAGDFNIITTTVVDAGRNANAETFGTVIGRNQYKINNLEWAGLEPEVWHKMLESVKDFYVPVTFEHPETGEWTTIIMYPGDRTATPLFVDKITHKIIKYRNCKFNLIDTGR